MKKRTPRRKVVAIVAMTLATFSLGVTMAALVAGSASASSKPSPKKKTTTSQVAPSPATPPVAPADKFSAINGTVNAASDHEIVGSSAFPNYTTGAVDNYYTMSHAHVDNSPFAEGTASPFDTGPVGQTAAAGNFQQPQYADARWPGGPDQATYGSQGGPSATGEADNNRASADASEASNAFSGPGVHGTKTLAVPKGFNDRLQQALATWNSTWSGRLGMKKAAPPKATTPAAPVTVPSSPVKPPVVTVTTPAPAVGGVTVPSPKLPSAGGKSATRAPASVSLPKAPASLPAAPKAKASPSAGGTESALSSSTLATLVYKTDGSKVDTSENNTCKSDTVASAGTTGTTATTTTTADKPKSGTCILVLKGESSMGRVSIGGGAIVIDGIHVTASITNDGTTPSYDAAVSIASASIGGIPVTIDQNGVHVAGQGQGLPYQQASAALNSALNQAGIKIFLVQPEVTNCGQSGTGSGTGTTSTTTSTTSTTSTTPDQSGSSSSCGGQTGTSSSSCSQSGSGGGGTPGLPAPPSPTSTQSSTTTTPSPCGQSDMGTSCDQSGTGNSGTTTTSSGPAAPMTTTSTTTTTTGYQSSTTTTPSSSCDQSGMTAPTSSCTAGTGTGTTTGSSDQSAMTATTSTNSTYPMSGGTFQFGPGPGTNNAGEETVTATGVHIVFTQPVSPSGVPAQFVEHILGEVFVDSLATPATPLPNIPFSSSSLSSSPSSSCGGIGGHSSLKSSGSGMTAGGSSSLGGTAASGSGVSAASSSLGSTSQPSATSAGNSIPARFATALKKPLWLLLAYLVWQALVVGTGWSLWNWRRGGT